MMTTKLFVIANVKQLRI